MIKFFNKIRYNLMETGKTGKYFKYAIGEIVLVVIGILIALQINNWNENQKEIAKSKNYLREIVQDLIADTISMADGIKKVNEDIQYEVWALKKVNYTFDQTDSLRIAFGGTYYDREINLRTFQNIQNSGNFKLTGYDSIFKKLSHYYMKTNDHLNAITTWDEKVVSETQDYMRDLYAVVELDNNALKRTSNMESIPYFPLVSDSIDQLELIIKFATSVQGRNHFKENYTRHLRLIEAFTSVNEEATSLIKTINAELDRND